MHDVSTIPIMEIAVSLPDREHFATASTISGLMGILMSERWPRHLNGPTWQHALASCMRSLQGELQPTRARQVFVSAARAAHLKVLPDDEQRLRSRAASPRRKIVVRRRELEAGSVDG
ncbi:DUF982 domain-containing protein (plasmid) [Rhizobium leguminosarum]|uniref:DUF982 domain-containing protein n=3 Tax=Rhizobium leguminosarum TaxID=384 RepID=UPI000DE20FEB|nr:DUF982 domain-containing protein [Rhizobium leguminosarum bv. viciae]TAU79986.1 DUF982 domain-containing protein [Rhizobium leguminosarum]NKK04194.1 DUF982 domain-containing protein [Rhizobium leguminosarum bv. viciae]NKK90448.1 DUF982 domain-containing protein [Rhizobium leguminosarum bv. viciae]TAU99355.1 DUF982 domain-containing protein [Rhizobium leguminosarum]